MKLLLILTQMKISKNSLKSSAENLQSTLKSIKGTYNTEIPKSNKNFITI